MLFPIYLKAPHDKHGTLEGIAAIHGPLPERVFLSQQYPSGEYKVFEAYRRYSEDYQARLPYYLMTPSMNDYALAKERLNKTFETKGAL